MFYVIYYIVPDVDTLRVETCRRKRSSVIVLYILLLLVHVLVYTLLFFH